jgi:hypothetical protein
MRFRDDEEGVKLKRTAGLPETIAVRPVLGRGDGVERTSLGITL